MFNRHKNNATEIVELKGIYSEIINPLHSNLFPTTVGDIINLRLENILSFDNYYDTSSAVAYSWKEDNKFKILGLSKELLTFNGESDGKIITNENYELINSQEFKWTDMVLNRPMTIKEVEQHIGWLTLAGNPELLQSYSENIFKKVYDEYGKIEAMPFFIRGSKKLPFIHPLCLDTLAKLSCVTGHYDTRLYARIAVIKKS